ncbi:hypothetical protein NQ314_004665 [Rhamnusium bicolor]|uniref:RWD domain-containing protein n=1 Tax=Rhamnusium bicolor TaxID=1586634 RepID=A0AAV8ZIX3_9CUCU|nr:hypothetical protein NQ314_004665 [Rhamnusium bicolor]
MDNISQQSDEIEVLKSIFEEQWEIDTETGTYSIQIEKDIKLFITLNPDYPSHAPPKYDLLAPGLSGNQKELIKKRVSSYLRWIEKLKEIVSKKSLNDNNCSDDIALEPVIMKNSEKNEINPTVLNVTHGPTIIDRKSVFQGHAEFMNYLLENKKIAQATHNISAYRISLPNSLLLQVNLLYIVIKY